MSCTTWKIEQEPRPCTRYYSLAMGIPCAHELAAIVENSNILTFFSFHAQWYPEWNSTDVRVVNLLKVNLCCEQINQRRGKNVV